MSSLKSWLARKAARLIVSDPEAVRIIAEAMTKAEAASSGIVWSGLGEIVITANPGTTPAAVTTALAKYDAGLRKRLPVMMREAERRWG